ncbi:MAG: hypothetical protein HON94_01875, partial [Methylococcales bacterium]|nr:hypothetical protein [Methylococcales bacterium]
MAFCSIIYELAIAKTVSLLTGNVVLWESLTISVYIAGLGIGAYIYAKSENSQKEQYLLKAEIILAITASFSIVGIFVLHVLYRVYFYGFDFGVSRSFSIFNSTLIFGFLAQIMTLLVAVPSGIELPALLDMVNRSTKKDSSNRLLAFFYFGTLVGTFWFAWAWLPYVDIPYAVVFTVSLNVCLCLWLMKEFQQFKPISIAVMMSVIVFCFVVTPVIYQIQLKNFYSGRLQKITQTNDGLILFNTPTLLQRIEMLRQQPTVERIKTHAQMIDVVTKQSSKKSEKVVSIKQPYRVHMNGHFQFSSLNEADYHEHMVHVPLALHETLPCHVLVLGAGDGLLIRELLKHDEICDITLVEYDQGILDFAINDKRLSELNKNSLQSSKVKIVVNDAFMYLRQTKSMYDAIYI